MKYEIGAAFGILVLTFLILAFVLVIILHPNGQVAIETLVGPSGASGASGPSPSNAMVQGFFSSITKSHAFSSSTFIVLSGETDTVTGDVSSTMQSQHYLTPYPLTFGQLTARGSFTNGTGSVVLVDVQAYRGDQTVTGAAGAIGNGIQFMVSPSSTVSFPSTTVTTISPVSVARGERLALVLSSNGNVTVNSFVGSASWSL